VSTIHTVLSKPNGYGILDADYGKWLSVRSTDKRVYDGTLKACKHFFLPSIKNTYEHKRQRNNVLLLLICKLFYYTNFFKVTGISNNVFRPQKNPLGKQE
jgi:hypothetical protein